MTDGKRQISDEQLITNYQEGDSRAFETLVKRYEKELYHFLYRFMGQASLAEEAFQEAFLQIHLSAAQFETTRRFRPWLYTIAANKARDIMRSRMRRPSVQLTAIDDDSSESDLWAHLLSIDDTPDKEVDLDEQKEIVREAVARMPDHLRQKLRSDDIVDQYTHTILETRQDDGHTVYVIESIPLEEAAIVWGREVLAIRDDWIMLEQLFYDQDDVLVQKLQTLEIGELGGRTSALRQRMGKVNAEDEWTELAVNSMQYDVDLDERIFSVANLKNPRE